MKLIVLALCFCAVAFGGRLPSQDDEAPRESAASVAERHVAGATGELRMQKRFGIGFGAAGGLSVFGISADFNLAEQWSVGIGFGTGVDYTTWNANLRYYLFDHWISPYVGLGVARWWTEGTNEKRLGPSTLTTNLLRADEDPANGFSAFLLYPMLGVQLFHKLGFAVSVEVEQLFRMFSFGNATYGGVSFHWYL